KIYFEQSKAKVKPSSMPELKRLYHILRKHNEINLLIAGHTDNQGKAHELQQLSQQRAEAIKTYLVRKGIAKSRLETVGHGASQPLNSNANDNLREKNRRVELIITRVQSTLASHDD
ncbi:MAG: OmpA family protein, partial [Bacteroidota bacterium]